MQRLMYLLVALFLFSCNRNCPTWADEFNDNILDTTIWSKIPRGKSPWNKNMATDDSLFMLKDGCLILRGVMAPDSSILTAGVKSFGKKHFGYGRLEIRAKLEGAQGAWPALWMIPDKDNGHYAEIDICERLNFEDSVYQTVHTRYNLDNVDKEQRKYAKGAINPNEFNVYGMEHYKDSIRFFVNDTYTFTYHRSKIVAAADTASQWPFDRDDMYVLMDMQIGASWPGEAKLSDLPISMYIDWIRFYEYRY